MNSAQVSTQEPDLYADYAAWKGWANPFTFSAEEGRYFEAELGGRKVGGLDVLEIGFGNGNFLGWARAQAARVSGSEVTSEAVEAARREGIPLIDPNFEQTDGLPVDSYDIVAAFDVFEHLDPDTIAGKLRAIAQALRPDGLLLLRFPNGQSPYGLAAQNGDATHVVALSRAKVEQYASGSGLITLAYGGAAVVRSGRPAVDMARGTRRLLQRIHQRIIRFIYATDVELAPVVTHLLVKQNSERKTDL